MWSLTTLYSRVYTLSMPRRRPRHVTALRLSPTLWDALERVKQSAGIPITWQLERAAVEWLKKQHRIRVQLDGQ